MDAEALIPPEAPARTHGAHGTWVVAAAIAAHVALVVDPLARAERAPPGLAWILAAVGPGLLTLGLARRSPWALLLGVPLGWALPSYVVLPRLQVEAGNAVALLAIGAYLATALQWLRAGPAAATVAWRSLDGRAPRPRLDPQPWLAAAVVAGPALGVALWPPVAYEAAAGFPAQPGRALVGLGLLGTLVGLAMATDLARNRPPLRGERRRAVGWALAAAGFVAVWAAVGG